MTTRQGEHGRTAASCQEGIEDEYPSLRSLMENEASTDRSQSESKSSDTLETVEGICSDGRCIDHEKLEQAGTEVACSTNGAPESEKEGCSTNSNHSEMSKLIVSEAREERRENNTDKEDVSVELPDAASAANSASSSFFQSHERDLNFSGPRGSSGHIANTGSISMRSDSSATSTRSFAFPM